VPDIDGARSVNVNVAIALGARRARISRNSGTPAPVRAEETVGRSGRSAGVADAYLNLGGWGYMAFREAYPRAKAAALRALAIDENLAEAHVSLAMVQKEYDWDWQGAGRAYERALELNPNYAVAHQWYGEYLAAVGRHGEAIETLKRAIELDPLSLIIHATLGRHGFYFARRYDDAIAQLRKTLDMDENFWVARHFLGWTYANIGRATTDGIESFLAYQPLKQLTLRLDYTFTAASDEVLHEELLRRPKHRGTFDANWQATPAWQWNLYVLWVGTWVDGNRDFSVPRLDAPGYTTVNLATSYDLNARLALCARVDNLFDRHYENPVGFLQPSIGVYAGVRVKL